MCLIFKKKKKWSRQHKPHEKLGVNMIGVANNGETSWRIAGKQKSQMTKKKSNAKGWQRKRFHLNEQILNSLKKLPQTNVFRVLTEKIDTMHKNEKENKEILWPTLCLYIWKFKWKKLFKDENFNAHSGGNTLNQAYVHTKYMNVNV